MTNPKEVHLLVNALREEVCKVAFEPDGAVVNLAAGDSLTVDISGPGSGRVEISHLPDGITVGAWDGSVTRVRNRAGESIAV